MMIRAIPLAMMVLLAAAGTTASAQLSLTMELLINHTGGEPDDPVGWAPESQSWGHAVALSEIASHIPTAEYVAAIAGPGVADSEDTFGVLVPVPGKVRMMSWEGAAAKWSQRLEIADPSNPNDNRTFGQAISMSRDGQYMLVSAPAGRNINRSGEVYFYGPDNQSWSQVDLMQSSGNLNNTFNINDCFGCSVSMETFEEIGQDYLALVIGAPWWGEGYLDPANPEETFSPARGKVHHAIWDVAAAGYAQALTEIAPADKIFPDSDQWCSAYGACVAIGADILATRMAIGVPYYGDAPLGDPDNPGILPCYMTGACCYLGVPPGGVDPEVLCANTNATSCDQLGGNWLGQNTLCQNYLGCNFNTSDAEHLPPGYVVVYKLDRSSPDPADWTWEFEQKLTPSTGQYNERFGSSMSFHGSDRLVIGAPEHTTALGSDGIVYAYDFLTEFVEDEWVETDRILPPNSTVAGRFGDSVSVNNDELLIGAPGDDSPFGGGFGMAYRYTHSDALGRWILTEELSPGSHAQSQEEATQSEPLFGASVAMNEKAVIVGAPRYAFMYPTLGGPPVRRAPGVAFYASTNLDDPPPPAEPTCATCDLDQDGDVGVPDLLRVLHFMGHSLVPEVDLNADGGVDIEDLVTLVGFWGECPE
ncbi:MAG: hypothetical protein MK077_07060 [Phycisphaerales bacterium]|nr:hypothetical protein [Phycisphaerales bacterium]